MHCTCGAGAAPTSARAPGEQQEQVSQSLATSGQVTTTTILKATKPPPHKPPSPHDQHRQAPLVNQHSVLTRESKRCKTQNQVRICKGTLSGPSYGMLLVLNFLTNSTTETWYLSPVLLVKTEVKIFTARKATQILPIHLTYQTQ